MDMESGFQIDDLLRMLRRRAALIGWVTVGVFLAAVFVGSVLPNEYEAWSTLLVEPQTISKNLVESGLEEADLTNRLHLMTMQIRTRSRLSRVVDDLGLYEEESKEMTREEVIGMMNSRIHVEPILPELALQDNLRNVQINTFKIFFRSDDPQQAAAVANRLASDFIEEHIEERVESSETTLEFVDAELERIATRMAQVEDRIAQVKSENSGSLPQDLNSNRSMLGRATDSLRAAERELALARSDAAFYRQQAQREDTGESYRVGQEEVSPARRLQMLELELSELRSRGFTEKHPDVIATRQEIAAMEERVREEQAQSEEDSAGSLSLAQQSARAEAHRAELRADAAREEIERLRQQVAEYEARIAATPRVQEQLAVLQDRRESLAQSYQEYAQRRQQAAVAENMERRQQGEQFRILESAFPPSEPVSPNRPLIVVVGLLMGLALGGGLAVLLEASDTSFHHARSLQGALGVPVLAAIPAIELEADRRARRRRRLRNAVLAGAAASAVLVASVVGNWMVNGAPAPVSALFSAGRAGDGTVD